MSYYNLDQALRVFQDSLPDTLLPFDLPQLAHLCRQNTLTPVFGYHLYISKPCHHEDDGRPIYAQGETHKFKGYLTHDHLVSLIDGYTDSLSFSVANNVEGEKDILLFDRYQRDPQSAEPNQFTVIYGNIRIAADEVKSYVVSKHTVKQNTPEQDEVISDLKKVIPDSDKTSYTTLAIDIMNAVIREFWIDYDSDQPAPKQSTITSWMVSNFDITRALALNIDKVCRHDSAKSGGKYKR